MSERFQILSLDGGGIKGLFSAAVLAHLEEDLNCKVADHFDLIVGTSTGGIIALGLGFGLTPKEIVDFYVKQGPRIFAKGYMARAGRACQHIAFRKFASKGLEQALKEVFGEATLGDSKKRLVVPSYNLDENHVYLFKTPHHERLRRDWRIPMWKVARATSAAPTYFSAYRGVDSLRLIDGGVWANNPCMVGVIEATSMLEVETKDIRLFSIGTTDEVLKRPGRLDWGGLGVWACHASDVILRGQVHGALTQAIHAIGHQNVMRVDPKVPKGLFKLDKLTAREHLAKAAHWSRQIAPEFKQCFMSHRAPMFDPRHNNSSEVGCTEIEGITRNQNKSEEHSNE